MGGLRISERHGVNPSLAQCFWCGQDSGELILFGRLPQDHEAPRKVVMSYEPCEKCDKQMGRRACELNAAVWIIEVSDQPTHGDGQLAWGQHIGQGAKATREQAYKPQHYPTGRMVVVKERVIRDNVNNPEMIADVIRKRATIMQDKAFEGMFGETLRQTKEETKP